MTAVPTISVVIPSFRRLERLPPLVDRYLELGADQVLIVLDGPHPGWEEALSGVRERDGVLIVVTEGNEGLALTRVCGTRLASGDVVLMADDDVDPGDGLIETHRSFHVAHPGSALLGFMPVALPARRGADQAPTYIYARDYLNQVAEWEAAADPAVLAQSFWTGNASVPRDLLLAAEDFKPAGPLDYNEDLDLGMRLQAIGAGMGFDRAAAALHRHSRGIQAYRAECVRRGVAVADMERRWERMPDQLVDLVVIPRDHHPLAGALQRRVAEADRTESIERAMVLTYRVCGRLRIFAVQDAVARFLRRALAIRGYRARRRQLDVAD